MNYWVACCSNKIIHGVNTLLKELEKFKSFLQLSQDPKVNLFGLQQDT